MIDTYVVGVQDKGVQGLFVFFCSLFVGERHANRSRINKKRSESSRSLVRIEQFLRESSGFFRPFKIGKGILLQPCVHSKVLELVKYNNVLQAQMFFFVVVIFSSFKPRPLPPRKLLPSYKLKKRFGKKKKRLRRGDNSFYHRFSVQVSCPVDEVEGPKEDGEHNPGHLVDLADAVVRLLGVHHLGLGGPELHRRRVGDGGDGHVLGEVGGVVDARRAHVVGLLRQHHGVSFLRRGDRIQSAMDLPPQMPFTLLLPPSESH